MENWKEKLKLSDNYQLFQNTFTPEQQSWFIEFIETEVIEKLIHDTIDVCEYKHSLDHEDPDWNKAEQELTAKWLK